MIGILAALGALLAGLYLALRDGLPWTAARRTGLIRRPGAPATGPAPCLAPRTPSGSTPCWIVDARA